LHNYIVFYNKTLGGTKDIVLPLVQKWRGHVPLWNSVPGTNYSWSIWQNRHHY